MVKSISRVVQTLIEEDPPLQDAIRRGYANYSSVARLLRPRVSEAVGRKVKLSGIATSVRRVKLDAPERTSDISSVVAGSVLSVRTDVAKLSVEKTEKTLKAVQELIDKSWSGFLHILVGSSSITIILDQRAVAGAAASFEPEEVLDRKESLAALMIQSPEEIIDTPGCISVFYRALSRIGLNIEETVSCFSETIVLISMESVGKALAALTELISTARAAINKEAQGPLPKNRNMHTLGKRNP
ncbi:MAG: hypothetical protein H5T33_06005 [Candidatus Methanosuratus sp.]|nr:hypothetical protein [Candidatus Methanosuratincola sp.]